MIEPTTAATTKAMAFCRRRSSASTSSRNGSRRRSVGDSFAEYNPEQVDLTRLAIAALKQYMMDDFSDDEDNDDHINDDTLEDDLTVSSFGYSSDNDSQALDDVDDDLYGDEVEDAEAVDKDPAYDDEDDQDDDESVDLVSLVSSAVGEEGQNANEVSPTTSVLSPQIYSYPGGSSCSNNNKLSASSLVNFAHTSYLESPVKKKKSLCFGTITIREYAVTVGALSASNVQCPLQLSWEHGADVEKCLPPSDHEEACLATPPSPTSAATTPATLTPRRLTLYERRKRIAAIQGIPEESVDQLQFDNVMNQIRETMNIVQMSA